MATNVVKNQEFVDLLNQMGFKLPPNFDVSGNQHSEFKTRLTQYLGSYAPDQIMTNQMFQGLKDAEGVFNRLDSILKASHGIATKGPNGQTIGATKDSAAMAFGALRAAGVNESDMLKITNAARKKGPGISQGGKEFDDLDVINAVQGVLGKDNPLFNSILHTSYPGAVQPTGQVGAPGGPPPAPTGPTGDNTPPTSNVPTSTQTTPTLPSKATKGAGAGGGTPRPSGGAGAGDQGLPKNASDADVIKYFQQNYGSDAWMLQIPDFLGIARQIATGGGSQWSDAAIVSAVQQTGWWKQNGSSVFNYMQQQADDPVGFQRTIGGATKIVRDQAQQYGLQLDDATANNLANNYVKFGWAQDPTQLANALAGQWHYQNNVHTTLGDTLQKSAGEWLQPVGSDVLQQWGHDIIAGTKTYDDFTDTMKNQAASMFPGLTDQINKGFTMQQIVDPYRQQAAKLLEIDPNSIDFTNPKYMRALDQVDPKTGQHTSMSQSDWSHTLMMDPQYRYDFTDQARQAATSMGQNLLKTFGATA